jgi:hypothetical protein
VNRANLWVARVAIAVAAGIGILAAISPLAAQSAGSAGTVTGIVKDPTGAVVPGATVALANMVSGFQRTTKTEENGVFAFTNVPPNPYHIEITAPGFQPSSEDVVVRSSVPVNLTIALHLAGARTEVRVEAAGADLVETVPSAHTDVDRDLFSKLPLSSAANGMSDAITLSSPGVAADSNGLFHPLGDHAQAALYLDGQPITDQQSKQFSTQIPLNAIQSMEMITSTPDAQYGDKTSLVTNAVTRSGLGAPRPFGSFATRYGSFGSYGEDFALGLGGPKFGNFLAANSARSGRFLDSPEFSPLHDAGNNETIFDRLDFQPNGKDTLHLNLFLARNWFQIPNTYDQQFAGQDQRQLSRTFSIAPGYIRTFSSAMVLTVNPYIRSDFINYDPSRDPFADQPATIFENRSLKNFGARADLSFVKGIHNFKTGIQISRTHLDETFGFGITDPSYVDPQEQPGLVPYDLTRGGRLLRFSGAANIDQFAWYAQDSITLGDLTLNAGLRYDWYDGLTRDTGLQPRAGLAYHIKPSGTVLRIGYSHTFETPYNENLILSSSIGSGGLAVNTLGAVAAKPLYPGRRDQYNAGIEQAIDKKIVFSADYFWKYTDNAFDFSSLLNTPIVFPITWSKSKIDGVAARVTLTNFHGLTAYTSFGHSRARYFPPSNGGLIFESPLNDSVFRIDHDQEFQQTTYARYQAPLKIEPWIAFTWRYDSGMVAGTVPDLESALALTADEQAAMGFFCGSEVAAVGRPITTCNSPNYGATRVVIPAPGTYNPDHNPPRIAPRHLFDLAIGFGNLLRQERYKLKLTLMATNLTNNIALYNFLSTFSGTHFVAPRAYQAELGFDF